jgi:peptidoglycan/xylan/chitin deacetylase (PgdA/CDA1 family)
MFRGKRELVAKTLYWSGVPFLLSQFLERDVLLVLNYHRIGNPDQDLFGPELFSATADELSDQISFLKRHVSLVALEEALAFLDGTTKQKPRRCRVLITFDDGYLDNYELAFPILRSHGVQAIFFLVADMIGSCCVPWWDRIAYMLKTGRRRRFSLCYPADLVVDIEENGIKRSLRDVLSLYKRPDNTDSTRFILDLKERSKGDDPPAKLRRFLSWGEAREMISAGMMIGSHTCTHPVLSQLEPEQQRHELARSRALLGKQLGINTDVLAYPVGNSNSFSDETERIAQDVGYRAAFSFYGGTNLPGMTRKYDVKRVGVGYQSWPRFQVQAATCKFAGSYWP